VAKFCLATNERYKDQSGEWQERVEWHNIVAWQRLAEIVGEYLKKGSKAYIEGKLQTSSWEDRQSGETKYRTEIIARDLVLLGNANGNSSHESGQAERPNGRSGFVQPVQRDAEFDQSSQFDDSEIPF
jgi:single-strand DNA-binding protein